MTLCPDPQLGTRSGWKFCDTCAGIKPPEHQHDEFEDMSREELLRLIRKNVDRLVEADIGRTCAHGMLSGEPCPFCVRFIAELEDTHG